MEGTVAPADSRPCRVDKLNDEQRQIWTTMNKYFAHLRKFKDGRGARPQPFRLLVHGGPGTGISFLVESNFQAALNVNLTVACIAPTGIAASKLAIGKQFTISSTLQSSTTQDYIYRNQTTSSWRH